MTLWNFIEERLLPLFGEIPAAALDKVKMIFWIALGSIVVYVLVYLPFRWIMHLIGKCPWKGRWLV